MAERSGTSTATVTRFSRALGFRGTPTCAWPSPPRPGGPSRHAGRPTSPETSHRTIRSAASST
ncbi:hypothetical protein NKG94_50630 [Micromonospora sp. M12]